MPDKVAIVSAPARLFDYSRYRGNRYISRYNSASCWQRMNLHLQVCGKRWCLSANINKKNASEHSNNTMYYYYELDYYYYYYYYHLVPCNNHFLKLSSMR